MLQCVHAYPYIGDGKRIGWPFRSRSEQLETLQSAESESTEGLLLSRSGKIAHIELLEQVQDYKMSQTVMI